MAQHMTEPTALFLHLESSDLHTVKEFKVLIQDNITSARDSSFLNALVEFYIQTNSFQALDILAGIREPVDKPLLDKLNECMKTLSGRLPAVTLLSHIVRRQPSWLHKIIQAPLFTSLISSLKMDSNIPVLMCGILTVTTLLPMIPSQVGPFLNDICEIFARLASWSVQKPGEVHDVYQLHLQAAVYALFHRLYGMYPWNFVEFLQRYYKNKEKEFNIAVLPMLERVRIHPQLIVGRKATETDLGRWRKMEVHDILMECARVSLDTTESTRDDRSVCEQSLSESGRGTSFTTATRSNVSSVCKTASPTSLMTTDDASEQFESESETPVGSVVLKQEATSNTMSQDILSAMWSPAVDCGLTTPPTSHPPSPGGSMMDISLTSSFQMGFGDPSSSLTTPRDSPHSAISEDHSQRLLNTSDGTFTPSKASGGKKPRGKIPGALPRPPQGLQRTASAPSTPGYDWAPASPIRKYSTDQTKFNFGAARSAAQQAARTVERGAVQGATGRSRLSSGKELALDDSVAEEDSIEEESEGGIRCPKPRQTEENGEEQETAVSLKDLPSVIRCLSDTQPRSDDAVNAEVISIVNSPQRETGAFMSKVIAGLHQHKDGSNTSSPYALSSSTPKYGVDKLSGQMSRGTAEGADDADLSSEKSILRQGQGKLKDSGEECEKVYIAGESVLSNSDGELKASRPYQKAAAMKTVNQKLFDAKSSGGASVDPANDALRFEGESPLGGDEGPTPVRSGSTGMRQSNSSQGFTPIRDYSMDSIESPYTLGGTHQSGLSHQAFMSFAHLFPYVMPQYAPTPSSGLATPRSQGKGDDVSISSDSFGQGASLRAIFSPNEILDRHIVMGDDVHAKELSRIPLTSQKSVNWTHYGGAPPSDEINLLKGQVQLLHNQLLYERHKREVHAGRNRRLLGKTHKAKAYEELNSAMKDQLRLQEQEIQRLGAEVKLLRQENRQLSDECKYKDKEFEHALRKLKSEKLHLTECKEELNKLLVTHRQEVDKINKDLKATQAAMFDKEEELVSTRADIATNRHLKDEIARLNKEILLLGEANLKYKEKMEENKFSSARTEEEERRKEGLRRELSDCHDAIKHKNVQLEAGKSRIIELDALLTQRDRSIAEQKRYLESVKSLANGKVEAIEAKYNSLKKVNQRQEAHILKLTKRLSEKNNVRSQRSNPDGAQSEDSKLLAAPGMLRSRSNSPRSAFDRRGSEDSRKSPGSETLGGLERQTPLGDEGKVLAPARLRASPGIYGATPKPRLAIQTVQKGSNASATTVADSKPRDKASGTVAIENKPKTERAPSIKDGTPSPGLKLSKGSPFQRVHPTFTIGTPPTAASPSRGSALSHDVRSTSLGAGGSQSRLEAGKTTTAVVCDSLGSADRTSSGNKEGGNMTASGEVDNEPICDQGQLTRLALVNNVGSGLGSQGIASLLELDTSVEEPGANNW